MHFALLAWPTPGHHLEAIASPPVRPQAGLLSMGHALLASIAGLLFHMPSQAAGGHHAVDDASIVGPGQCQIETWLEQGRDHQLQHVGPACNWLGLELGLNLDRNAPTDASSLRSVGPQLKWARELQPGLSWGLVWSATWQSTSPRYAGQALLLPVSWSPRDDLTIHVNVGLDFFRQAPDQRRYGLALEWQATARWQGLIERWDDGQQARHRIGLRHLVSDSVSVDLSRAQARGNSRDAWWSLGLNWAFAR